MPNNNAPNDPTKAIGMPQPPTAKQFPDVPSEETTSTTPTSTPPEEDASEAVLSGRPRETGGERPDEEFTETPR